MVSRKQIEKERDEEVLGRGGRINILVDTTSSDFHPFTYIILCSKYNVSLGKQNDSIGSIYRQG